MEKVFRRSDILRAYSRTEKLICWKKNSAGNLIFYKIDVKPQATDLQRLSRIWIYLLYRQHKLQGDGKMSFGNYEADAELVRECSYKWEIW